MPRSDALTGHAWIVRDGAAAPLRLAEEGDWLWLDRGGAIIASGSTRTRAIAALLASHGDPIHGLVFEVASDLLDCGLCDPADARKR